MNIQATTGSILEKKSFVDLISGADLVVQLTILILLVASVWSWAIIIDKWLQLSKVTKKVKTFEGLFSASKMEDLFEQIKLKVSSPIEHIFVASFSELKRGQAVSSIHSQESLKNRLSSIMITVKNRNLQALEQNLSYLATISSVAPFIGLFGTVWGIMHSFQSIAMSKNTSLAIVAPGIAEALLATALGLIAAIPALMFYNIINSKISEVEHRLENFSIELSSIFHSILDKK